MVPAGKKLIVLAVAVGALVVPQAAQAEIDSVFDGDVGCDGQGSDGVRFCGSDRPARSTVPGVGRRADRRQRRLPARARARARTATTR